MSKFSVIIFPDQTKAYEGTLALRELDAEGSITLYSMAVITRNDDNSLSLKDDIDGSLLGTASGALVGGLIGLYGGPAAAALGLAGGAVLGSAWDLFKYGIGEDFAEQIAAQLGAGKSAIVAEISESWTTPLDARMEKLDGEVLRIWRGDFEDHEVAQALAGAMADYEELKAEFIEAAHEEKTKLNARLDQAKTNLLQTRKKAFEHLNAMEKEFEAKIQKLERQLADNSTRSKKEISRRIDALHADYKARSAKLKQAWSLTKEVLAP